MFKIWSEAALILRPEEVFSGGSSVQKRLMFLYRIKILALAGYAGPMPIGSSWLSCDLRQSSPRRRIRNRNWRELCRAADSGSTLHLLRCSTTSAGCSTQLPIWLMARTASQEQDRLALAEGRSRTVAECAEVRSI